ncbi:hypothetical protein MATL_G00100670 [Megalops atlanticus]|uniref:Uncharacterized protein n=1 Tax=Megalops atlanticus TaxID=7932 RepID=A0A9D3Q2T5_MEGAT|nr:hypothetical protein MATL_G00100670 [Megalops atlanticus]
MLLRKLAVETINLSHKTGIHRPGKMHRAELLLCTPHASVCHSIPDLRWSLASAFPAGSEQGCGCFSSPSGPLPPYIGAAKSHTGQVLRFSWGGG